ncbi:MAG: nitrous oxide-stimulated promoter family protein [Anaerolineaceae bacterium]
MTFSEARLRREDETAGAMIEIYCRGQHKTTGDLCAACDELRTYTHLRLEKCPFGAEKSTCAKCTVHCYNQNMRERIRAVMRYAGPRMLLRHPWMTVMHLLDGRRKPKARSTRTATGD